jgi:ABC-2 type transport system permease protein
MKMVIKIAKTELRNLFYSPVAWFLVVIFFIQGAVLFTGAVYDHAKWQEALIAETVHPNLIQWGGGLTRKLFFAEGPFFKNILQNLYLFVPLLTMGLISREINNGTIKLLYSSPVKLRQIVLGKYLAIMGYNLLLLTILGIFMVTGMITITHPDYGLLLSAGLGFYLLVCAYTAIGLFMSSLSAYEVVAAVSSFTVILVLGLIGNLWQKYDYVRDLTYFLSISGRTVKMLQGLITSKDVVYFTLIVAMFIIFTLIKLKAGRESRPWYVKLGRYGVVFALVLFIGYFSSLPRFILFWDTTAGQINTIHSNTQKIIKKLGDDPLEVTLYTNLFGSGLNQGLPEMRNDYLSKFWERYQRFKPDINYKYVYYYDMDYADSTYYKSYPGKTLDEIAKQRTVDQDLDISLFMPREQIRKIINLKAENYRAVMQLKYKGRTTFLRTFDDMNFWPNESNVSAAIEQLLQVKPPKIYYLTGNLERNIYKKGEREYSAHSIDKKIRVALVNQGFVADSLSLENHDIPADATALVLADPKTELGPATTSKLNQYINLGGNLYILGEPGKQQILNPLLQHLGIELMNGTLVEITRDETPDKVISYITPNGFDLAPSAELLGDKTNFLAWQKDSLNVARDTDTYMMPGVTGIAYSNNARAFQVKPLMVTREDRDWIKAGKLVTDSVSPVLKVEEGDSKIHHYCPMVSLTRQVGNRQQRIVVAGDADFMSNVRNGGESFSLAIFSWLDYNKFPVYAFDQPRLDNYLQLNSAQANALKITYVWVLPSLILILGFIILIRRKRN